MGKVLIIIEVTIVVFTAWVLYGIFSDVEPPVLPEHYWGPKGKESVRAADTSIRPFKINISDKILTDLKQRLTLESSVDGNRLIPPLEDIGFQYGFNTKFMKTVVDHWLNKYNWRAREAVLNKYPHFKTYINGIEIHFQHVKTHKKNNKETKPLLLIHGWPGSIIEFQRVIPLLETPENSDINFELIIPSLPGYGFSEAAVRTGLGYVETAQILANLMKRLGHETYFVHGGDWGALVGTAMAALYPERILGYHSNTCVTFHPKAFLRLLIGAICPSCFMDEEDVRKVPSLSKYLTSIMEEGGYIHLQATKPDTLGIALSNSPTGLAAHILEKFSTWTNDDWKTKADGGLLPYFDLDDLLDNVMVYWVTNTITTSIRYYSEGFSPREFFLKVDRVPIHVPSGFLSTRHEFLGQTEFHLQDKYKNILSFTRIPTGGHFASFELPQIFAKDVIQFFNTVYHNIEKK